MIILLSHHKSHRCFFHHLKAVFAAASAAVIAGSLLPAFPVSVSAASGSDPADGQNLPVIRLETGSAGIGNSYIDAYFSSQDENGDADLTNAACMVRLRGNSSRHTPKKSYKLHFPDKANPLQLGEGSAKTWALIGNGFDASLLRNRTAMQIAEQLSGLSYTPNCRSAEVWINSSYAGVYLLIETVSVNKHRINLTEEPESVSDNGYLIEMTRYAEAPDFYAGSFHFEVKSKLSDDAETAEEQVAYISGYTDEALRALRSGSRSGAEAYLDLASLVDNCLLNEICKNIDVGWDSYYLSKDAGGKLCFGPVWDFDLAFGNGAIPYGYQPWAGESIAMLSDSVQDSNPWLCYALRCGWFRQLLKARFDEMLPALRTVSGELLAETAAHGEAYQKNYDLLKSQIAPFLPYEDDPAKPCYTQAAQAEILADWLEKRLDWLDAYYHSPEFDAGIFPDDHGNALTTDNLLSVALLSQATEYRDCSDLSCSGPAGDWYPLAGYTPFMLEKGEQYCLSFDYSGTGGAEIVCQIEKHMTEEPMTVTAGSETQRAMFCFTADETDPDAGLTIYGNGSGSVRLDHISLKRVITEPVSGDLNGDGQCSIADAVLLVKWLLCEPEAVLSDWHAGDMNADGRLDARDLALLRRTLAA